MELDSPFRVAIFRSKYGRGLSQAFTVGMTIIFIVNNFFMGTQMDAEVIRKVVKVPVGPAIGFGCQYMLMPLVSGQL